jgi:hypothetical protein
VQALEPYGVKVRFHLQAVCVVGVFQAREDEQKRDDTYDILRLFGSGHIAGKWMTPTSTSGDEGDLNMS